jgi:hypothetical protein
VPRSLGITGAGVFTSAHRFSTPAIDPASAEKHNRLVENHGTGCGLTRLARVVACPIINAGAQRACRPAVEGVVADEIQPS